MKKGPQSTPQEAEQKLIALGFKEEDINLLRTISDSTAKNIKGEIEKKQSQIQRAHAIGNQDIASEREQELTKLENKLTNLNYSRAMAVLNSPAAANNISRIKQEPFRRDYGYTEANPMPGTEAFATKHLPELHVAKARATQSGDPSQFTNQWRSILEPHIGYFTQRANDLVESSQTALDTHRTILECVGVDLQDKKVQGALKVISERAKRDMAEFASRAKEEIILENEISHFSQNQLTNDMLRDYKPPVSSLDLSALNGAEMSRAAPRGAHPKPEEFAAAMAERNKAIERKRSGENVLPPTVPSASDTGAQAKAPSAEALLSRLTTLTQEKAAHSATEHEVSHQNPLFGSPQLSAFLDKNKTPAPQETPDAPQEVSNNSLKK